MKNISNGKHNLIYARLTKTERIKSKSLLINILKEGQKIKNALFGISYKFQFSDNSLQKTVFGISVSKKVASKAHERNRIKRVYRHAWQSIKSTIETQIPNHTVLCLLITVYEREFLSIHAIIEKLKFAFEKIKYY